jgi:cysteinyl-tRNA synthetase
MGWDEENHGPDNFLNSLTNNNGYVAPRGNIDWTTPEKNGRRQHHGSSSIFNDFSNQNSFSQEQPPPPPAQASRPQWSTNVTNQKKTASTSSSIFDQNNNAVTRDMDDDFNASNFLNDVFKNFGINEQKPVAPAPVAQQSDSSKQLDSLFGGPLWSEQPQRQQRQQNSVSTSSNRSNRLPVFQELTENCA